MLRTSRIARLLLLAVLLLAPLLFFSSSMRPHHDRITGLLQELVYPLEYVLHASITLAKRVWYGYIDLRDTAAANARLRVRLAKLQTRLQLYEEKNAESRRLRALLGLSQRSPIETVAAEVVAQAGSFPFLAVRVNRGSRAKVNVGMAVIGAAGVVGRVLRVGQRHADVQLLTDSGFYIDILVQRTRLRGMLRGNLHNCVLQMPQSADLRIGDTIVTSGLVGNFPKGLPIGRVVRISYEANNVAQQITVEPWVDYRQLEEVSILLQRSSVTQRIVSSGSWLHEGVR